ncbi:MAG: hypothetical protein F4Y75_02535 [Acidimicrobiia bacterium]|nr:hypothetical protein [Acidimicrobiia bacterium]MYD04729.1 hypothetical protein [Acidimicrobiia bacterium]
MKVRLSHLLLLFSFLAALAGPVIAQDDGERIEIIKVGGNLDRSVLSFVSSQVDAAAQNGATAVIIQLDSGATLSDQIHHLAARIADPALPLVVWVGPAPARAYGGAALLLSAAPIGAAAPGVWVGHTQPVVAGGPPSGSDFLGSSLEGLASESFEVADPTADGLIDIVAPSISNLLVELEGASVMVRGESLTLRTLHPTEDGTAAIRTVFYEPPLGVGILRLATGVEAAFFFLVVGLAVAAFEFYALGPGIASAVAALMLLIGGYGLTVLPFRGWALGLTFLGLGLLTADFQRGRTALLSALGGLALLVGGLFFTDAAPQIRPSWWIVAIIVVSVVAFYAVGMRTVARARFSTPTLGRTHLIGRLGRAITRFDPGGIVEVEGARWHATAHREAGLGPGDPVVVRAVEGPILEVDPLPPPPPEEEPDSDRPPEPEPT